MIGALRYDAGTSGPKHVVAQRTGDRLGLEEMAMTLAEKKCGPCTGELGALSAVEIAALSSELRGWQIKDGKRLLKSFQFDNFQQAMDLAQKIASVSEQERHHPDLLVRWGELKVELWTHKVDALTENDFILAAKIDQCAQAP